MPRTWMLMSFILLSPVSVWAQVTQQWVTYDGSGTLATGAAIATDGQGTVFVAGNNSFGPTGYDYSTVAYDATTGAQLWAARYNGPANSDDYAFAIALDGLGRVFVTGGSWGGASSFDYATVAYDATTGAQLWAARYNGPGNGRDSASGITADGLGAVYVTGQSFGGTGSFEYATVAYDAMTGT